jgi:hypothetical protein
MGCVGRRGWGNSLIVALFALVLLGLSGVGERNSAAAVACTLWYDNNHVETYYDPLTGSCAPTGDPDTQVLISTYQGWIFHDFKVQVADTSDRPPCVFLVSDEGSAVPDEHLHFLLCSYPEDLNDQYGMTFQVRYAETSTTTAVNITFSVTCQYYTLIQCFGGTPATMTITGGLPKLSTAPASLPEGAVGAAYSQSLAVTGGVGTITYALTGTLPRGLSFDTATGLLSGTPTQAGTFPMSFTATDASPAGSGGPQKVTNTQLSLIITGTTIPVPTTTTLQSIPPRRDRPSNSRLRSNTPTAASLWPMVS